MFARRNAVSLSSIGGEGQGAEAVVLNIPARWAGGGSQWKRVRDGRIRKSLVLRRSAGFQTSLERVGGMVAPLPPKHTLSRFGNRRSAKDSRMRPELLGRWTKACLFSVGA